MQNTGKSNSITTVQKDSLCVHVGTADLKGHDSIKRVYSPDGKSPTLTTMGGGHREPKVAIKSVGEANARQRRNMKRLDEKGFSLTATAYKGDQSNGMTNITNNLTWRKLTPLECERLQTVADNYTAQGVNDKGETVPISNTQRYRALGNGWTVEVIKHIFGGLYGKQ